jgi:sensor histidine kinase YesM
MEDTPTVPADLHRSRLIFGAGALAVCVASVLAIAAAIECHTAAAVLAPGTTWTPSLLYGSVLWLWWAGVAYLLWQVGRVRPAIFRLSGSNLLLQIVLATLATTLHLASLHWSTRLMAYIWSAWRRTGFGGLHFFELGRFTLDFVTYVLVWLACGIVYMQLAAQRHAFQSLELQQQLSTAKLHALQMQLQPHFLFNTLNGITTLVRLGRQKEADTMLSHLNGIP